MIDDAFDRLVGPVDPAMVVVTTCRGDERAGCLVGFHAQSSIEPRHYCIWLSKQNHTYRLALDASVFAVHFLAAGDREVARTFGTLTGDEVDKFQHCDTTAGPSGVPLLDAVPNRLVGRRLAWVDDGGDHVMVVLQPIDVQVGDGDDPFEPLRISAVDDLEPGHQAG